MLSPTPLSLLCVLLLFLPLAIFFTFTAPPTTTQDDVFTLDRPNIAVALSLPTSNTCEFPKPNAATSPLPPPPLSPPRPLSEHEDDIALLRIASQVNPKPTAPKKIAFMFLTTTPLYLAPLWELFFSTADRNRFNIYIHADPCFNYSVPFSGIFSGKVIPSKPARRFSPTLISAARRLVAYALLHDPSNYMFALLSPSCAPLHSFDFTYKTLIDCPKSYIELLKNEIGAFDRWAARGPDVMLPTVPLHKFRIGSQFWVLTRKHAKIVVSDRKVWAKFNFPCIQWDVCYPEENYFPTLLSMRDPRGCIPATLTHVDWYGRFDGHPRTYEAEEVAPDLIVRLRRAKPRYGDFGIDDPDARVTERGDPFLFARKFSPDSLPALMRMAKDVIFNE